MKAPTELSSISRKNRVFTQKRKRAKTKKQTSLHISSRPHQKSLPKLSDPIVKQFQLLLSKINARLRLSRYRNKKGEVLTLLQDCLIPRTRQEDAIQLDLYLTIDSIYKIILLSPDVSTLKTKIKQFFSEREDFLQGESLNYCNNFSSQANILCLQLARILFPGANPENIVLHHTLTQGRTIWKNPFTQEENLPKLNWFFVSARRRVELYTGILEQAIANLKRGYVTADTIWDGTDTSFPRYQLSEQDLKILSKRSPGFKKLVDYVEALITVSSTLKQKSIFDLFAELRQALKENDYKSKQGSHSDAGEGIYLPMQNLNEWWHSLPCSPNGLYIQREILRIQGMQDVLDNLYFTQEKPNKNDNVQGNCIYLVGQALEKILENQSSRKRLYALSKERDFRISDAQLDLYAKTIHKELIHYPKDNAIPTDNNIHEIILYISNYVPQLISADWFNYRQLHDFKEFFIIWHSILKYKIISDLSLRIIPDKDLFAFIQLLNWCNASGYMVKDAATKELLNKFFLMGYNLIQSNIKNLLLANTPPPHSINDLLLLLIYQNNIEMLPQFTQRFQYSWEKQHLLAAIRVNNDKLFAALLANIPHFKLDNDFLNEIIGSNAWPCFDAYILLLMERIPALPQSDWLELLFMAMKNNAINKYPSLVAKIISFMHGSSCNNLETIDESDPKKHALLLKIPDIYAAKIDANTAGFAKDKYGHWYPASIIESNDRDSLLKVHFQGWEAKWDEWISLKENFQYLGSYHIETFDQFCQSHLTSPPALQLIEYLIKLSHKDLAIKLWQIILNNKIFADPEQHLLSLLAKNADCCFLKSYENTTIKLPFSPNFIGRLICQAIDTNQAKFLSAVLATYRLAIRRTWLELAFKRNHPECVNSLCRSSGGSSLLLASEFIKQQILNNKWECLTIYLPYATLSSAEKMEWLYNILLSVPDNNKLTEQFKKLYETLLLLLTGLVGYTCPDILANFSKGCADYRTYALEVVLYFLKQGELDLAYSLLDTCLKEKIITLEEARDNLSHMVFLKADVCFCILLANSDLGGEQDNLSLNPELIDLILVTAITNGYHKFLAEFIQQFQLPIELKWLELEAKFPNIHCFEVLINACLKDKNSARSLTTDFIHQQIHLSSWERLKRCINETTIHLFTYCDFYAFLHAALLNYSHSQVSQKVINNLSELLLGNPLVLTIQQIKTFKIFCDTHPKMPAYIQLITYLLDQNKPNDALSLWFKILNNNAIPLDAVNLWWLPELIISGKSCYFLESFATYSIRKQNSRDAYFPENLLANLIALAEKNHRFEILGWLWHHKLTNACLLNLAQHGHWQFIANYLVEHKLENNIVDKLAKKLIYAMENIIGAETFNPKIVSSTIQGLISSTDNPQQIVKIMEDLRAFNAFASRYEEIKISNNRSRFFHSQNSQSPLWAELITFAQKAILENTKNLVSKGKHFTAEESMQIEKFLAYRRGSMEQFLGKQSPSLKLYRSLVQNVLEEEQAAIDLATI